jgi:hypothetical protein
MNIDIPTLNFQFAFSIRNVLNLFPCHSLEFICHLPRNTTIHNSKIGCSLVHLSVGLLSIEISWTIWTDKQVIFYNLDSGTGKLLTRCSSLIFVTEFQIKYLWGTNKGTLLTLSQKTLFLWTLKISSCQRYDEFCFDSKSILSEF